MIRTFRDFVEEKETLVLEPLPYKITDLEGSISKDTMEYHYNHLAGGYVDRFNKGIGDKEFNKAGTYLHNLYFQQFKPATNNNSPEGSAKALIDKVHGDYSTFKTKIKEHCMGIQGSGWCYMDKNGSIMTIANHKIVYNIALLIDWWEHGWALDYKWDKEKYLDNIWKIINWNCISDRIIIKNKS